MKKPTSQRRYYSMLLALPMLILLLPAPAVEATETGSMLRNCQSELLEFSSTCLGFMAAIDETHHSMRSLLLSISADETSVNITDNWPGFYCSPMQLTPEQLRDVFVNYALSNPDMHELPAALTTLVALNDTLPCSN